MVSPDRDHRRFVGRKLLDLLGEKGESGLDIPESSDNPRHRGEPKPRAQRGGQRGDLAVCMRLPRTLRVLEMTLSSSVSASYRWTRDIRYSSSLINKI